MNKFYWNSIIIHVYKIYDYQYFIIILVFLLICTFCITVLTIQDLNILKYYFSFDDFIYWIQCYYQKIYVFYRTFYIIIYNLFILYSSFGSVTLDWVWMNSGFFRTPPLVLDPLGKLIMSWDINKNCNCIILHLQI